MIHSNKFIYFPDQLKPFNEPDVLSRLYTLLSERDGISPDDVSDACLCTYHDALSALVYLFEKLILDGYMFVYEGDKIVSKVSMDGSPEGSFGDGVTDPDNQKVKFVFYIHDVEQFADVQFVTNMEK